jgi:hypothetical protein
VGKKGARADARRVSNALLKVPVDPEAPNGQLLRDFVIVASRRPKGARGDPVAGHGPNPS